MLAFKLQMPGNNPKENKQHLKHGESLKSRLLFFSLLNVPLHVLQQPFSLVNVLDLGQGWELLGSPNSHGDVGKAPVSLHTVATISFFSYAFSSFISWQQKLCYIKIYEILKKHKMKMDVLCVCVCV
jgi:hypothetical protein